MKKQIIVLIVGLGLFTFLSTSMKSEKSSTRLAGVNDATIVWTGTKITGSSHTGTIDMATSSLEFDGKTLVGGSFKIDMNSIRSTDLEGEYRQKLEGHLKSEDFFGTENYPFATFKVSNSEQVNSGNSYKITGEITIKETTKTISFPMDLMWEHDQVVASGSLEVNRADFDVKYGSGRFFDGLGDKTINDAFKLDIRIVSKVSPDTANK